MPAEHQSKIESGTRSAIGTGKEGQKREGFVSMVES